MNVLPASVPVHHVSSEGGIIYTRTRVMDSCEAPCGCWGSKSGPLVEQPELLAAEPSLQLFKNIFFRL